jgi:hypothetical protein
MYFDLGFAGLVKILLDFDLKVLYKRLSRREVNPRGLSSTLQERVVLVINRA